MNELYFKLRKLGPSVQAKNHQGKVILKSLEMDIMKDAIDNCPLLNTSSFNKCKKAFVKKRLNELFEFHRKRFLEQVASVKNSNRSNQRNQKIAGKNPAFQVRFVDVEVVEVLGLKYNIKI